MTLKLRPNLAFDNRDISCSICLDPIDANSSLDKMAVSHKNGGEKHPCHLKCAIQCLLASDLCSFCKTPLNKDIILLREKLKNSQITPLNLEALVENAEEEIKREHDSKFKKTTISNIKLNVYMYEHLVDQFTENIERWNETTKKLHKIFSKERDFLQQQLSLAKEKQPLLTIPEELKKSITESEKTFALLKQELLEKDSLTKKIFQLSNRIHPFFELIKKKPEKPYFFLLPDILRFYESRDRFASLSIENSKKLLEIERLREENANTKEGIEIANGNYQSLLPQDLLHFDFERERFQPETPNLCSRFVGACVAFVIIGLMLYKAIEKPV